MWRTDEVARNRAVVDDIAIFDISGCFWASLVNLAIFWLILGKIAIQALMRGLGLLDSILV